MKYLNIPNIDSLLTSHEVKKTLNGEILLKVILFVFLISVSYVYFVVVYIFNTFIHVLKKPKFILIRRHNI